MFSRVPTASPPWQFSKFEPEVTSYNSNFSFKNFEFEVKFRSLKVETGSSSEFDSETLMRDSETVGVVLFPLRDRDHGMTVGHGLSFDKASGRCCIDRLWQAVTQAVVKHWAVLNFQVGSTPDSVCVRLLTSSDFPTPRLSKSLARFKGRAEKKSSGWFHSFQPSKIRATIIHWMTAGPN
jgi:hypothetical protein